MSKPYGLILASKSKLTPANTIKKPSIFQEESDSDNEVEKPTGISKTIKRQDRVLQEKAVEEDPTVYQYDEIYDKMEQKKMDTKLSRKELDKKPKYITKLLAAADKRKRENERRIERQVQKEREAEGDEFKDKESFVTTAYRKKLEELKKLEEEEKREEYLESIGDVAKQGNLDGFYRHLYDQKVNYADKLKEEETKPKSEIDDNDIEDNTKNDTKDEKIPSKKPTAQKRRYRKRESSESDENKEKDDEKRLEHLPSNIDADSDFSIDSDSDESGDESKSKKVKIEDDNKEEVKVKEEKDVVVDKKDVKNEENGKDAQEKSKEKEEIKPKKPKIDIWKKRTVGAVFDEALQRYFERKALREAAK
ncbi:nuclear speckle splicing regulatory protein 1 [Holotrichia oblita]|uniref:Nuclear speckle splicing regulatory protein 1 n=2 Tax=Holotrichia oblita TaxID=644536 RepID=A0ACB9SJV5_HOLOL|nr:nuclear speckle splicing regulatory protein 1 [Holotrichia oblita]KAI4455298.1 nuclear speckle splicing regulatory protein 1 [Holotrichia oblita]